MNRPLLTVLLFACLALVLRAQTNAPAPASRDIEISSKEGEFDLKTRVAIYRGNVQVVGRGMQLTCETLTAKLSAGGNRIENFVGEEKVVFDLVNEKGEKLRGTGDKMVYTYTAADAGTNEMVELTGNPVLETAQGVVRGDVITYDRLNGKLKATNYRTKFLVEGVNETNMF